MGTHSACTNRILRHRKQILAILVPILLLPLPIVIDDERAQCGYVFLLMVTFWILEIVPYAITSFMPFLLFPILGIMPGVEVAGHFFRELTMAHMGAFMVVTGMEKSGLNRRIALRLLLCTGSRQHVLLLLMMICAFIPSMWSPNLAVSVLIMSVVQQIVTQLHKTSQEVLKSVEANGNTDIEMREREDSVTFDHTHTNKGVSLVSIEVVEPPEPEQVIDYTDIPELGDLDEFKDNHQTQPSPEKVKLPAGQPEHLVGSPELKPKESEAADIWFRNLFVCYALGVTFAAKLGGVSNIRGSPNNLLTKDLVDQIWQREGMATSPVDFTSWLVFSLPSQIIALVLFWVWFCLHFMRWGACSLSEEDMKYMHMKTNIQLIKNDHKSLGKIKYSEYMVSLVGVALLTLFLFESPDVMSGWSTRFPPGFVTLTVPSAMVFVVMMLLPGELSLGSTKGMKPVPALGDLKMFVKIFPWSLILIIGGSNALADGMTRTGLVDWVIDGLAGMDGMPDALLMFVLCLMVALLTEITANTLPITIFVPLASNLAESIGKNPLYLIIPVSLSAAYSFILPVGGTTNAWLVTSGNASVKDYVKVGFLTKLVCVLLILLGMHTWGAAYYDFDVIPWSGKNSTIVENTTASVFYG